MGNESKTNTNNMKNFTLTPYQASACEVVRLTKSAQKILISLQTDTGMSASKIASKCIEFAFEHYEGDSE